MKPKVNLDRYIALEARMSALRTCPFCGSDDLRVALVRVCCRGCGASGPEVNPEIHGDGAPVDAWNLSQATAVREIVTVDVLA